MISRKPASGGINKLPRNFLTDGRRVHQFLKSSIDMLFSAHPSTCFKKVAALRNMSTTSLCELGPSSASFVENIVSNIAIKTDSRSDLTLSSQYDYHQHNPKNKKHQSNYLTSFYTKLWLNFMQFVIESNLNINTA